MHPGWRSASIRKSPHGAPCNTASLPVRWCIAIALALTAYPLIWWRWRDSNAALVVALALLAACSTATIVDMILPSVLDKLGLDPAFGSGPLVTVIQDLLSIIIYFGLVVALS